MDDQTFSFSWQIKNFSISTWDDNQYLLSDTFVVPNLNDTCWQISFFPRDIRGEPLVSIYVKRVENRGPTCIEVSATLKLIASDGTIGYQKNLIKNVKVDDGIFFMRVMSIPDIQELYSQNDVFKLECVFRKAQLHLISRNVQLSTDVQTKSISGYWELKDFGHLRIGEVIKRSLDVTGYACFDVDISIVERNRSEVLQFRFNRVSRTDSDQKFSPVSVFFRITVLEANGTQTGIWSKNCHVFQMPEGKEVWDFPTFLSKSSVMKREEKYLLEDVLTMKYELSVSLGTTSSKNIKEDILLVEPKGKADEAERWKNDMQNLQTSEEFWDVILCASDGNIVPVHKLILGSQSKRFSIMLDSQQTPDDEDSDEALGLSSGSSDRTLGSQKKPGSNDIHEVLDLRPGTGAAISEPQKRAGTNDLDEVLDLRSGTSVAISEPQKRAGTNDLDEVRDVRTASGDRILDSQKKPDGDVVLELPDLDMSTLKRMLNYMYTSETENLEFDDTVKLYIAAYKYGIKRLQCICSFALQSMCNVGNADSVLKVANDCADSDLRNCAMEFI